MTSLGIMTLSRGPYSELDKMSLFQDLKLKRRKVDSRCSSDGESLADTSTSSPDLSTPLSPKMCDQTQTSIQSSQLIKSTSIATTMPTTIMIGGNSSGNSGPTSHTVTITTQGNGNCNTLATTESLIKTEDRSIPISLATTTSIANNTMISNTSSVIRSVADERMPSPRQSPVNHSQRQSPLHIQYQSKYPAVSMAQQPQQQQQQHVTVLVTPSRIKTEQNQTATIVGLRKTASPQHHMQYSPVSNNFTMTTTIKQEHQQQQQHQHQQSSPAVNLMRKSNSPYLLTPVMNSNNNSSSANGNGHLSGITINNRLEPIPTSLSSSSSSSATLIQNPHQLQIHMLHAVANSSAVQMIQQPRSTQMSPNSHNVQQSNHQHQQQQQQRPQPLQSPQQQTSPPHHQYKQSSQQSPPTITQLQFPIQLQALQGGSQLQHQQHSPLMQHQAIRIKRERSPIHTVVTQQNSSASSVHNVSPTHQRQSVTTVTPVSPIGQLMHPSLQLRHPMRGDAAILFRVKNEPQTSSSIPQQTSPHRMVWGGNARINGVKPEIIGGPMPGLRPSSSSSSSGGQSTPSPQGSSSQTPPRATPTVIMGESCGVRTMVWGFEPSASPQPPVNSPPQQQQHQMQLHQQQQQQQQQIQQQQHNAGPSQQNNEEAAQLLLSLGQGRTGDIRIRPQTSRSQHPLNMERLWAGDYSQLPAGQQMHALNLSAQQQQQQQQWGEPFQVSKMASDSSFFLPSNFQTELVPQEAPPDDDEQPLVCMICEDKATGLHYGIITCEGCKGFFKRTVQNRRIYTCVADGTCEITKSQRNRCQYCRFKKCIEQGMVLQAVREDRMPGGRNSGAVYNLYKVKYKKHKKSNQKSPQIKQQITQTNDNSDTKPMFLSPLHHQQQQLPPQLQLQQQQQQQQQHQQQQQQTTIKNEIIQLPSHLMNGTILKTALTNPSEIVHLRHRLDNAVSSSKDRSVSYEHSCSMIQTLIDFDAMEDIATLPHFPEFLEDKSEISHKLCNIGDSIVHKLVSWTKKLPFYLEIPVAIHTKLLTDKWHEILVLTTAAYQALHGKKPQTTTTPPPISGGQLGHDDPEFVQEVNSHLCTLQTCLTTLMGHPISMEQLREDVGDMVKKMTQITIVFRRIKLKMEEYVCLKVYILLNKEVELESIQERYVQVLRSYLQHSAPHNPGRLGELLAHIPEIQAAASLLLESKMFYVPFVLNSANIR